jgi:hypothetical protein
MRKLFIIFTLFLAIGLAAGPGYAVNHGPHVNALNEPGSLLVYPLIDNINGVTIVNIANTGTYDVDIECYSVTHGPGGGIDQKNDFVITLTPKEKFVWLSNQPYNQRGNQIGALDHRKGYLFCWAIDNVYDQYEKTWNYLKGDATFLNLANARAFNYNAIAHQREPGGPNLTLPDKVLALDGHEYTMATSQIMFEGLAEVPGAIGGTLVVANPGIDFVHSKQPEFDINVYCWNEVETKFSRHLKYKDFEQYDLTKDLQLEFSKIFTLGFQCATTSTHALWAVFKQDLGRIFGWGGNVWQHPGSGVRTEVELPGAPQCPCFTRTELDQKITALSGDAPSGVTCYDQDTGGGTGITFINASGSSGSDFTANANSTAIATQCQFLGHNGINPQIQILAPDLTAEEANVCRDIIRSRQTADLCTLFLP